MITAEQPFVFPIRIYYDDTDAGGVVYHSNYLKFFERARTEWLSSFGIEQDALLEQGIAFMVRRSTVEHYSSARFNERLQTQTTVSKMKRASIVFQQRLMRGEYCICEALVTIACVDLEQGKPIAIPDPIREVLIRDR